MQSPHIQQNHTKYYCPENFHKSTIMLPTKQDNTEIFL